jgi:hypothetical protein
MRVLDRIVGYQPLGPKGVNGEIVKGLGES